MIDFHWLQPHCFLVDEGDGLHLYQVVRHNDGAAIGCRYWGKVDDQQRWEAIGAATVAPNDIPSETLAHWLRAARLFHTAVAAPHNSPHA